jgi:DNA-binding NarL/FixJ family response regulator
MPDGSTVEFTLKRSGPSFTVKAPDISLTLRELEVLDYMNNFGLTAGKIAMRMGVSYHTVATLKRSMLQRNCQEDQGVFSFTSITRLRYIAQYRGILNHETVCGIRLLAAVQAKR